MLVLRDLKPLNVVDSLPHSYLRVRMAMAVLLCSFFQRARNPQRAKKADPASSGIVMMRNSCFAEAKTDHIFYRNTYLRSCLHMVYPVSPFSLITCCSRLPLLPIH